MVQMYWDGRQFRWFGLLFSKWASTLRFCCFNSCMMSPLQIESRVKLIAWLIWPNCLHHRFQMVCHGFDWYRPSWEQSRMNIDSGRVAAWKGKNKRRENVYLKTTTQHRNAFKCKQWKICVILDTNRFNSEWSLDENKTKLFPIFTGCNVIRKFRNQWKWFSPKSNVCINNEVWIKHLIENERKIITQSLNALKFTDAMVALEKSCTRWWKSDRLIHNSQSILARFSYQNTAKMKENNQHLHRMRVEYQSMLSCIHIVQSHFVCNHDTDNAPNPNPTMYKMLHSIRHSLALCVDCYLAAWQRPNSV